MTLKTVAQYYESLRQMNPTVYILDTDLETKKKLAKRLAGITEKSGGENK